MWGSPGTKESCYLVMKLCPILCDSVDCSPSAPLWDFPGENTEVGCHFLLQEIFLIQELNLGHLHCRKFFTIWASRETKESD